jgi:hypothetical protein
VGFPFFGRQLREKLSLSHGWYTDVNSKTPLNIVVRLREFGLRSLASRFRRPTAIDVTFGTLEFRKTVAKGLLTTLSIVVVLLGWHIVRAHGQIAVKNQGYVPFSDAPINYRSDDLSDPVAKLQRQLTEGKAALEYEPDHGYLRSVLTLLKVPIDSQTLVFSKTSFQYKKISPDHPRALYFNDDVYVGSVHEGKAIEIVSFDPKQGAIFYLLDEHKVEQPTFQRAELDCTQCHIAAGTRGVPGVLLRSIYPTDTGTQAVSSKSYITDQESPLKKRWDGWYVTGKFNGFPHMGNAVTEDKQSAQQSGQAGGLNLVALSNTFDPSTYLIPDSDIVAHLVLAHQTQMHNLITLTNYKTRLALYAQAAQNKAAGLPEDAPLDDAARKQFERPAEQLLRYLLFVNEAPLPGSTGERIQGSSSFEKEFAARGIRDAKGRSLRDFDLRTRTFRYPCSYLIYTESFDALPESARGYVYHRLLQVLTGEDQSPDFAKLSGENRKAILEILLATKPGLPEEWRDYAKSNHMHVAASRPHPHRQG